MEQRQGQSETSASEAHAWSVVTFAARLPPCAACATPALPQSATSPPAARRQTPDTRGRQR
eukprot:2843436-Rhodomonas_salina.1